MISICEQVLKEHMNYDDRETVKAIAEASEDQNQILVALTSKLYEKIVEKADKIDFSSVSRSRGDITKIENYTSLCECLEIIRGIVVQYKEDTTPIDIVNSAMENVRSRAAMFKKAFVINAPLAVMTYNTITLSIVSSVSFLIATCIEYVKTPDAESFQMALDTVAYNKTQENLLFDSLSSFNEGCKTGEFDDAMKVCMERSRIKNESAVEVKPDSPILTDEEIESGVVIHDDDSKVHSEGVISNISFAISRAFVFIAKALVPMIRGLVYFHYSIRQKRSDYWEAQATLLEMNANKLQYNTTIDVEKKNEIIAKQRKIAEKFRNKSNKFNVDYSVAKRNSEKMMNDEAKKYAIGDLDNYDPGANSNDVSSSLF